jgi:hypothetical protein
MQPPTPPLEKPYRPTSGRQRLIILALAIAMGITVLLVMLGPQLRFMRADHDRRSADKPPCRPGQTTDCVGGTMGVIVTPEAPLPVRPTGASSAARPPPR